MKIVTPYYTITPESIARERERLLDKASHDEAQALYHATQVGMQKGRQEGLQKGRQEGLQEGMQKAMQEAEQEGIQAGIARCNAEVARNALKLHLPVDIIRQLTGLSEAEIEELGRQL